ncbi:MAG TPA: gluconate 2-dehydrogenase subunit 3 family protein [Cyclobacteriaceae bacterium]|nr:gluconate 2-dehydrogenase subunit 3 family protein [Cyclobacteriaceae bacterium]
MKRRTAIRNVVLMTAGAALLNGCVDKKATIALAHIPITGDEEDLLTELTETIIPRTDFPGAKDLRTAEFIFTMADDCSSPENQKKFTSGMKAFDETCKAKMGSRFVKLSNEKRGEYLGLIEADKEGKEFSEELKWFYRGVKSSTIRNFTTSQQYMTEVRNVTTLIPAKFQACVPVASV